MGPVLTIVITVIVIVAAFLALLRVFSSYYRKVGPNRALIVYGAGGTQVAQGGARLVIPLINRAQEFSLELMSFDVAPQQNLYTNQGVSVRVEAVTQLKVRSDKDSILTAAEQFLSKTDEDREGLIRLVMEGHLRGIVGQLTIEQLVKEPEMVSEKMRQVSSADLAKMGLEVVSFTIKEVRDENDYISNMGRPEIERIKKEANIAVALASRDTQIQAANASREAAVAKAAADQARVEAEAASQAKQSEFQRDLALKRATYDAEVKKQQVIADKATELQVQVVQQQIVQETARAQQIEKTAQVKVQEAESQRRQMELEATVINTANAERQRMETLAAAERQRLSLEAEGRAAALRAQASAEAEATRIRGLAEAEVIRAKGEAEAEAMRVKAAAYHEYNQAAVLDKIISNLPEMMRALAEPLSKVDKISIVSTGSSANGSLGASRLTGDMVNIMAQAPAILEALTGVRMADLFARVPGMTVESDGAAADGDHATPPAATASPASGQAESQAESQPSPAAEPVAASDTPTDAPSDAPAEVTANAGATSLNGAAPSSARGPRRQRAR
ncbi:MAG TPA: SPFH domain-containing protein [Ktedonobacterales bacterium]